MVKLGEAIPGVPEKREEKAEFRCRASIRPMEMEKPTGSGTSGFERVGSGGETGVVDLLSSSPRRDSVG